MRRPMDFWKGMVRFLFVDSVFFFHVGMRGVGLGDAYTCLMHMPPLILTVFLFFYYAYILNCVRGSILHAFHSLFRYVLRHTIPLLPLTPSRDMHIFALRIYLRLSFLFFHHAYILNHVRGSILLACDPFFRYVTRHLPFPIAILSFSIASSLSLRIPPPFRLPSPHSPPSLPTGLRPTPNLNRLPHVRPLRVLLPRPIHPPARLPRRQQTVVAGRRECDQSDYGRDCGGVVWEYWDQLSFFFFCGTLRLVGIVVVVADGC